MAEQRGTKINCLHLQNIAIVTLRFPKSIILFWFNLACTYFDISPGAAEKAHQAQVRALEATLRQVTASKEEEAEQAASSVGQRLKQQNDNVARLEVMVAWVKA